jgi:hypothetical protein
MKPLSWEKQLGLASPLECAAIQSNQTNNPSNNEVRNEVGLDVTHHTRISQRGGENLGARRICEMKSCGRLPLI